MALSVGLDSGVSALRAAQIEIDTAAHNISNANTPGYSRQEVMLQAVPGARQAFWSRGGNEEQVGLGVEVSRIRRLRDSMLDGQYRAARAGNDAAQSKATSLQQAEAVFNEPSDTSIAAHLASFFNAFSELASSPESLASRAATVQQASSLAATFNSIAKTLQQQRDGIDTAVALQVSDVNAKASEIADLNARIQSATVAGDPANDLHDRRDQLLDELSGQIGATITSNPDDTVDVKIGGHSLVSGAQVDALKTVPDPANGNHLQIQFASDNSAAAVGGGQVKALLDARDTALPAVLASLDKVAAGLISAVNAHHAAGYGINGSTGLPFFTGAGATDIAVNATIVADPANVAASDAPNEPGSGAVALLIAGVKTESALNGNTATIGDGYATLIAGLGGASKSAQATAINQAAVVSQIDGQRQAVSGVSVDEEMTNLIKGQHAYAAAARIITTVDSMLDTLVNMIRS